MKPLIIVICNPAARRYSTAKIEGASSFLHKKGFMPEILLTGKRGHAQVLAYESLRKNPRMIIAAGGDGTINEVINGIVRSDVPLAVLPLGTTNVLTRELGISGNIYNALETAVTGTPRTVSLGRIETGQAVRYFCLMAGIGFDGKSVYDMKAYIKKVSGETAYILSGIKNLIAYCPGEILCRINGREYRGYSVIIGKAACYGGNFKVTPGASLLEPSLCICIFKGARRRDLLRYVYGIIRGRHLRYRDVEYLKSAETEIKGVAHIQIDGDYLGVSPAKISVAENSLRLIW